MSFPRKIYVDSRFRTDGSASHSDFTFQLARSIELPAGTRAVIDSVQIPNVFRTVDSTRCKLYLSIFEQADQVVSLDPGQYNAITLASHVEDKLNAMSQGVWTVVFNVATGQLSITVNGIPYAQLKPRDPSLPNDALEVVGCDVAGIMFTDGVPLTLPHHIDIVGVRVLFLASNNFGAYNCLGPRGESDYVRQIMVNESNGGYITDKLYHPGEYISCGGQQIQSLRFRLVDGNGRIVDMMGRSIAFSIIFLD
jgi:hypothetical protein